MKSIGSKFPEFNMKGVVKAPSGEDEIVDISSPSVAGKWFVVFYYPKDFTFVCPTEIKGFADLYGEFKDRETEVFAASVDSEFVHKAWKNSHADLKNVPFPMLADVNRKLASSLGILIEEEGVAYRATFVVDPDGVIRHVSANDLGVGRNPKEILRILDALQTDELCPCNWQKGDDNIKVK